MSKRQNRQMPKITAEKLAEDVVRFAFKEKLGREPEASDYDFQRPYLLDGTLDVATFCGICEAIPEGRIYADDRRGTQAREVHEFDGCTFTIPANSSLAACLRSPAGYEPWALPLFLDLCRPGATVVDIGANYGVYAVPAARRVGPGGKVVAFEAAPENAAMLMASALASGIGNIEVLAVAVSDRFGMAALPSDRLQNSGHVVTDRHEVAAPTGAWEPVATVRLDAMVDEIGRIDLMKMDIEGGEYRACKGAEKIISADRPIVFSEFCPLLLRSISKSEPDELMRLFLDRGYVVDVLHQDAAPERVDGSKADIIARIVALCQTEQAYVDLRLTPIEKLPLLG